MKKPIFVLISLAVVGVVAVSGLMLMKSGDIVDPSHPMIRVTTPVPNALVTSPLQVKGVARGNWYFEASFPMRLYDGNNKEIALGIAQAKSEWMTTEFVPFDTMLIFNNPGTPTGTLVLEKDNPSGLPEHDDQLRIPVRFEERDEEMRTVRLYYYNESKDKDISGNILCSTLGLEAVEREIAVTLTPIQDSIRQLIRGELTFMERQSGISTEFPLTELKLESASASGSILTLAFSDPQNKTSGGSCRVNILRAQIEATAKQFGTATEIRFSPEELFQP